MQTFNGLFSSPNDPIVDATPAVAIPITVDMMRNLMVFFLFVRISSSWPNHNDVFIIIP